MSDTEDLEKITSIYSTLYPYQKENLLSDLENCTILNSHKGEKREDVKPRHRGEKASKRGLPDEQVCLLTAVQREGDAVLKATNMAAPKAEDIAKIEPNFADNSFVWIDGKTAYQRILTQKNCEFRVLGDHKSYTSIDHLNNVNSFHSKIDEWNRGYRGVATKYINRYAALLVTVRKYAGLHADEVLLKVKAMLNGISDFFRICDMKTTDLFAY